MKVAIVGATGRMGAAVIRLAQLAGDSIVCAIAHEKEGTDAGIVAGIGQIGVGVTSDLGAIRASRPDVVVDFSNASVIGKLVDAVVPSGAALVSGTTGIGEEAHAALLRASSSIAVLWEPNMSIGVHVLTTLVEEAARMLGFSANVEIVETHHNKKKDAPSGTALRLAEAVQRAHRDLALVHGREGDVGARKPTELGMFAVRGGDVIGDHQVHFFSEGERLELTHRATNRDLFAQGALRAARKLYGSRPGKYSMRDVLGS